MQSGKFIYFTSDHHFGIPDRARSLVREKRFVRWLEDKAESMEALYIMGDLFDFWHEYRHVVPRGYALVLGALAKITSAGIPVHYYRGNHDIWAYNYFKQELGFIMHRDPETVFLNGKKFYLAHGDGLGPGDHGYKFLKKVFENRINQWLFRQIHPDLAFRLAYFWSGQSRYANAEKERREKESGLHENTGWLYNERLPLHASGILKKDPGIDYFVFGHWHLPLQLQLTAHCTYFNIGDWLHYFTYLVFDGENLRLEKDTEAGNE